MAGRFSDHVFAPSGDIAAYLSRAFPYSCGGRVLPLVRVGAVALAAQEAVQLRALVVATDVGV